MESLIHKGWFGRPESLDPKLNQELNNEKIYDTLRSDPDGLAFLIQIVTLV